jgi:hypothetical protein
MIENKNNLIKTLEETKKAISLSLGVMSLASIASVMELPAHFGDSYLAPSKDTVVDSQQVNGVNNLNPLQREKTEVGIEHVSYSESQRTPSRSGSV